MLAKHNLHFYNARVVTVRQPTIKEIVSSLKNAYELGKITHPSSPTLSKLSYENLSAEMKDALKNMMTSTQIYVHYLGWNSRYDEWLALHKIRVDEIVSTLHPSAAELCIWFQDSKQSLKAAQELIPPEFPQQLFAAAIDYCKSFESLSSSTSQRGQGQGPSGERARPSTSSNSSSNSGDKDKDAKSSNHSKVQACLRITRLKSSGFRSLSAVPNRQVQRTPPTCIHQTGRRSFRSSQFH